MKITQRLDFKMVILKSDWLSIVSKATNLIFFRGDFDLVLENLACSCNPFELCFWTQAKRNASKGGSDDNLEGHKEKIWLDFCPWEISCYVLMNRLVHR